MTFKLFAEAIIKYALGIVLVGVLLFVPARTVHWFNGWLFMGILFIPMFIAGIIMMAKNPYLLEKRLRNRESEQEQSLVIKLSGLMFLAGFILAALDFRFGWSRMPQVICYGAVAVFLICYLLYGEVMRENTYLSRTVEVQENQKVIDTGMYGIVRHPMYAVTLGLFLAIPLILGSWISFIIFLAYPFIIAARIRNEEKVLEEGLPGYIEYEKKVRWHLIPFIW